MKTETDWTSLSNHVLYLQYMVYGDHEAGAELCNRYDGGDETARTYATNIRNDKNEKK